MSKFISDIEIKTENGTIQILGAEVDIKIYLEQFVYDGWGPAQGDFCRVFKLRDIVFSGNIVDGFCFLGGLENELCKAEGIEIIFDKSVKSKVQLYKINYGSDWRFEASGSFSMAEVWNKNEHPG